MLVDDAIVHVHDFHFHVASTIAFRMEDVVNATRNCLTRAKEPLKLGFRLSKNDFD